jgi:hypothetical protein
MAVVAVELAKQLAVEVAVEVAVEMGLAEKVPLSMCNINLLSRTTCQHGR